MARLPPALERYRELVGDFDAFAEAHGRSPPPHVRVNTLKTTPEAVISGLRATGIEATPEPWSPLMLRLDLPAARRLGSLLLHALGHYYIQSASSAAAALALDVAPGMRVLDLCASPGSKTTFLAQRMENRGAIVANEFSRKRLIPLQGNLRRMGAVNVATTVYAGQNFPQRARFDRVLVDAPCSGEGTWRGSDARVAPTSDDARQRLTERQAAILERAVEVLEPGGELIYSTCTYAPEENECVVGPAVTRHGLDILPVPLALEGAPGLTAWEGQTFPAGMERALRLYPHRFDSEGFFVVRLAKPAR